MAKQENDKKNKNFWKDFKAEIKKVIWPTKKQLINNTIVVIVMVLITALIVLVLDLAFEALNTYGINKIKQVAQDAITATEEENNDEDVSEDEVTDTTDTIEDEEVMEEEQTEEIETVEETTSSEETENN